MNPNTDNPIHGATSQSRRNHIATGVAASGALLLLYGLFRPDSLAFSIPFLIAPSLAMLWTAHRTPTPNERRAALAVTWCLGVAAIVVLLIGFTG